MKTKGKRTALRHEGENEKTNRTGKGQRRERNSPAEGGPNYIPVAGLGELAISVFSEEGGNIEVNCTDLSIRKVQDKPLYVATCFGTVRSELNGPVFVLLTEVLFEILVLSANAEVRPRMVDNNGVVGRTPVPS